MQSSLERRHTFHNTKFSWVVMLDDVQMGHYDSDVKTFIFRGLKLQPEVVILQKDGSVAFRHVNRDLKQRGVPLPTLSVVGCFFTVL